MLLLACYGELVMCGRAHWSVIVKSMFYGVLTTFCKAPNEEQVKLMIQLCNTTSDEKIKVQCIGTLECLAQHPQSIDGNKVINTKISLVPSY